MQLRQPTLVYCDPLVLLCTLYRYTDKPDHASTSYKCITVSNPSSPSIIYAHMHAKAPFLGAFRARLLAGVMD